MVTSIIQKSQLEGAHRLDAEYYQPEYLEYVQALKNISKPLGELVHGIKHPAEIKREYEDTGTPFLLTENISSKSYILQFEEKRFIKNKDASKISQNKLSPSDVVMTRTGANYGDSAFYSGNPENLLASAHVLIIRPKNITGEFLSTFLNSKIGKALVKRGVYGAAQPEISPEYLKTLSIPTPAFELNEVIVSLVRQAKEEIENSKIYYQQTEDLLLEELGLTDFKIEDNLSFVVNLSKVKSANRLDSDFFQPKYEALISHFKKLCKPLKDIAFRTTAVVKINPETEYKYIEISDINIGNGEIIANALIGKDLPANAKIEINGGELLISKVRPTRGAIAIVPGEWEKNYIASGAFSIFKTESPKREYLQVVLRSIAGRLQLEKPTTGTSYPTITDEDVENVLIPILPQPTQQKIADLVKKAHDARKKSKELLEKAKRKVEEMIEKGS